MNWWPLTFTHVSTEKYFYHPQEEKLIRHIFKAALIENQVSILDASTLHKLNWSLCCVYHSPQNTLELITSLYSHNANNIHQAIIIISLPSYCKHTYWPKYLQIIFLNAQSNASSNKNSGFLLAPDENCSLLTICSMKADIYIDDFCSSGIRIRIPTGNIF